MTKLKVIPNRTKLSSITVKPLPRRKLIELGIHAKAVTIEAELTERQAIELAAHLRAATAAVRVDGP